jgi:hypothetical protein
MTGCMPAVRETVAPRLLGHAIRTILFRGSVVLTKLVQAPMPALGRLTVAGMQLAIASSVRHAYAWASAL